MRQGIEFYNLAANVPESKRVSFTTDRDHWLVDLDANPKRFNIITLRGTALTMGQQETLLTINHGLNYQPKVMAYFYVGDAPFDPDNRFQAVGTYQKDRYVYAASGTISDVLKIEVTPTQFKVIHHNASTAAYTSTANTFDVTLKYYITSNIGAY